MIAMDTGLIYAYCNVIKEVYEPLHAIFFEENGWKQANINTRDEGIVAYSCESEARFDELVKLLAGEL